VGAAAVVHKKQKCKLAAKNKTKRSTTALPDSVLRMRRLKAKLKRRKQRQKITENPVALELERAKEKARRQRRKENGSIKTIAELQPNSFCVSCEKHSGARHFHKRQAKVLLTVTVPYMIH